MLRKSLVFVVMGTVMFLLAAVSSAQVPTVMSYQGKLTGASGGCLNDTVQMTFTIYADSFGTAVEWAETQTEVVVKEGVFSVLLGSVNHIPGGDTVFDGTVKYLGVQVESDPEMEPLKPMVSVAYAYRAGATDGGGVNCEDCDDRFVNVQGPDSVVATTGSAFLGKASGSSAGEVFGVTGYAKNSSSGLAYGGFFKADSFGTGSHFGVSGLAYGSSSPSYGLTGQAINEGSGTATGGYFSAWGSGSGYYTGVDAYVNATTPDPVYGVLSAAKNLSTGTEYGGYFFATDNGTGTHYGSKSTSEGSSSSSTYGCYGSAANTSSGAVYAGYFKATTTYGSGPKYGVYASAPGGRNHAGYFEGKVRITDSLVVLGAKSAAVKLDNGEYCLLYSQESPEVWFEDFGEGQLVNGRAHIDLDPLFLETVTLNSQYPMKVFIQLTSGEPMNVVVHKGITGFDIVGEDISSNATFDYRVVAKRKGYENIRLAKMGGPTPEEVAAEQERHLAEQEVERARMEQERMEKQTELR